MEEYIELQAEKAHRIEQFTTIVYNDAVTSDLKVSSDALTSKLEVSCEPTVYMLSFRERMELDLEAWLMGETLVLNRSSDLLYGYYIELNDLNVPLELRRDQVDYLMPTIEEGEWKIWIATEIKTWEISFLCKASCVEARRFDGFITIHNGNDNVTYQMARSHPREFYNSIMKDKVEYKGKNVVGAFMN
nr:hypothetical protein [Tanacetum cinerariifolium]